MFGHPSLRYNFVELATLNKALLGRQPKRLEIFFLQLSFKYFCYNFRDSSFLGSFSLIIKLHLIIVVFSGSKIFATKEGLLGKPIACAHHVEGVL